MVSIRRALGVHSERFGTTSAHGKASHVFADPGKMAMLGIVSSLRILRDRAESVTKPIDDTFDIVCDEYERAKGSFPDGIIITKSYNLGGVELNYEQTWQHSEGVSQIGIPIFTNEDRVAGSHLLSSILQKMCIIPGQADDANVVFTPGLGTTTANGKLIEINMRLAARGVFRALELLNEWAQRVPTR